MDSVSKSFPNLKYLSMLKNPSCPNFLLDGKGADDYRRFRYYVIYRMNGLKFLNSSAVTAEELKQAKKVCFFIFKSIYFNTLIILFR